MRRTVLPMCSRIAAAALLLGMTGAPWTRRTPVADAEPLDAVGEDLRALAGPDGKVGYFGCMNPGGPVFLYSPPMERLAARGAAALPGLVDSLRDPRRRDEAALVLARVGDRDAVPYLIELLSPTTDLPQGESRSRLCVLYALWRLTGKNVGIAIKFAPARPPDARAEWRAWYAENRDYLYTPANASDPQGRRVLVDLEAKLARTPTDEFRRGRPWVRADEVRNWHDDPESERRLREFCFQVLLATTDGRQGAIHALAAVPGPRALAALHGMCGLAANADDADRLIAVLGERGDASSLPVIERIPRADGGGASSPGEQRRAWEVGRLRLRAKYGEKLKGKSFDVGQQHQYLRCLDGERGAAELVAELKNRDHDCFLAGNTEVAGYVDREPVRAALTQIAADDARDDRAKAMAHAALARLGAADSLAHLRRSLAHADPAVRFAAAKGLWRLGHRDGVHALVELLDARPLETGREGVRAGAGSLTVMAVNGGTVEAVRAACTLLGEIGDESAIEPLRRLLAENLNGVLSGGGSGTGWGGRPDAVALARLGDFSGVAVLRAAIAAGDRLDVAGGWWRTGDFAAIGRRRFVPELLPLLTHRDTDKRACAALDVLLLLDRGR